MAAITSCPPVGDLRKLAAGDLPGDEMEAVFPHLESCPACLKTMRTLPASDTLLDAVAQAKTLTDAPDKEMVSRLIERLRKLNKPGAAAGQAPAEPLPISFECSKCGRKLKTRPELAGKKVKCPGCGQAVAVPGVVATAPTRPVEERTLPPREASGPARQAGPTEGPTLAPPVSAPTQAVASSAHDDTLAGDKDEPDFCSFLAPPQAPDEIGRLGTYRVLKVLGAGGMGVVFRAEDPHLERPVALKAMLPSLAASPAARKRFLREAKAAAAIKHDHIVTIHQVGEDRGAPFLAMEFLEGESLEDRLKRETKLPVPEVLRLGRQIAEGLAAAHAKGLIHRDIKPGNIWLESVVSGPSSVAKDATSASATDHGQRTTDSRVKILDFGLARAGSDTSLTQSGAIVGTPQYMAPEQAVGKQIDHRCDLFSLGCVLYRTCTGELPFKGDDTLAILSSLAMDTPKPPQTLDPTIRPELSDLIMRLLAKKPDDRPSSAREVADTLAALASGLPSPPVLRGRGAGGEGARRSSKRRLLVAAGLLLAAGLAIWLSVIILQTPRGQLIIKTDDPNIEVTIKRDKAILYDRAQKREYELTVGDGEVEVWNAATGEKLFGKRIRIERGGKEVVDVAWEMAQLKGQPGKGRPPVKEIPAGDPLCKLALVTNPALIKGVKSWTVETVGHRAAVKALAFSPKGDWLASGGIDGQVRIWDTKAWKLDRILTPDAKVWKLDRILPGDAPVLGLYWDKNDRLWVDSDKVHVWDPAKGLRLKSFDRGGGVWFFPDGERVLVGDTVYDATNGEIIARMEKIGLPDGKTLVTYEKEKVVLWDAQTDKRIRDIPLPEKAGHPIAWAPDAKTFACIRGNEVLRVDASNGKILENKTLPKNIEPLPGTAMTASDLAVASDNNGVPMLTLLSPGWENMEVITLSRHQGSSRERAVTFSPDGKILACSACRTGSIYLIKSGGKSPFRVLPGHGNGTIEGTWWKNDGASIVCHSWSFFHRSEGGNEWNAVAFEAASGKFLGNEKARFTAPNGKASVRFYAAGGVFTSWDGKNLNLDVNRGVAPGDVRGVAPGDVSWSHDSKILLLTGDQTLRLFSTIDGKEFKRHEFKGTITISASLSPDNKTVACSLTSGEGRFFDKDSGESKGGFGLPPYGGQLAFSPDGKFLVVGPTTKFLAASLSRHRDVQLRSPDGKDVLKTLSEAHNYAYGHIELSWSPDSKTLATAAQDLSFRGDGLIRLWNPATGKLNASLLVLGEGRALAASPQGDFLGTPHQLVRRGDVVYVFQTDQGIETLPPDEFEKRFNWKNDPGRVRPTGK